MVDLDAVEIRSCIAEPERGRRDWSKAPEAQAAVHGNRRLIRGARGRRLMGRRGRRSNARSRTSTAPHASARPHEYSQADPDHVSGFNLGLILRQMIGVGTPRGLQDRPAVVIATLWVLMGAAQRRLAAIGAPHRRITATGGQLTSPTTIVVNSSMKATCTTGCWE